MCPPSISAISAFIGSPSTWSRKITAGKRPVCPNSRNRRWPSAESWARNSQAMELRGQIAELDKAGRPALAHDAQDRRLRQGCPRPAGEHLADDGIESLFWMAPGFEQERL